MGRGCGWKRRLLPDAFGEASKRTVGMFITDSGSVVHFQHLALYSVHSASVCVCGVFRCARHWPSTNNSPLKVSSEFDPLLALINLLAARSQTHSTKRSG